MRRHLHVLLVVAILFVFHKAEEKVSYEGYKLMRLYPTTHEHVELISQFEAKDPSFDVWSESKNSVDVVIAPKALGDYAMFFVAKKIRFEVINDNIQDLINEEEKSMAKSRMSTGRNSIVYRYARHSEINNYIDTTADENSDIVRSYTIGTTSQNRQMKVLVFDTKKHSRSIWIDCGIHAREWVAPGTCVYLINKLLHDYRNFDPDTVALLDKYEVHVLPVVNPDGYEYTHTTNRLWRKNRTSNPGSACIGTDLNRNYGFNWDAPGASTSPCSETYGGASAESELETKALIGAITAKSGNWDAYITVHSYGQLWLVPFGYSVTDKPVNDAEIRAAAKVGADAIENFNGTQFTVGSSAEILYVSTGSSRDWANGVAGIKYSNTLELRPSSSSPDASYGFVWPESRLPEVVHETFAGIMAFLKHVSANPI